MTSTTDSFSDHRTRLATVGFVHLLHSFPRSSPPFISSFISSISSFTSSIHFLAHFLHMNIHFHRSFNHLHHLSIHLHHSLICSSSRRHLALLWRPSRRHLATNAAPLVASFRGEKRYHSGTASGGKSCPLISAVMA